MSCDYYCPEYYCYCHDYYCYCCILLSQVLSHLLFLLLRDIIIIIVVIHRILYPNLKERNQVTNRGQLLFPPLSAPSLVVMLLVFVLLLSVCYVAGKRGLSLTYSLSHSLSPFSFSFSLSLSSLTSRTELMNNIQLLQNRQQELNNNKNNN